MTTRQSVEQEAHSWLHFIARTSAAGRAWATTYDQYNGLVDQSFRALVLLRRRRVAEGRTLLDDLRRRLDGLTEEDEGIRWMLERWYRAVDAYYRYCLGALQDADRGMVAAHAAIAEALRARPFLTPVAGHCYGFVLHRADIARVQLRWNEMWERIGEAREMVEGRRPFCMLADGTGVGVAEIKGFYEALGPLSDEERESIRPSVDDRVRLRLFDGAVRRTCRIPGLVVPYP